MVELHDRRCEIWLSKSSGWLDDPRLSCFRWGNKTIRHRTVRFGVHPPTRAAKMKKSVGNAFGNIMVYTIYLYIYIIISCTYHTPIPLPEPLSFRPAISESVKESFLNVFNTVQLSYQKSKHRGSHREAKMFHSTHRGQRNELRLSPG